MSVLTDLINNVITFFHQQHINRSLKKQGREAVRDLEAVITSGGRSGRIYTYRGRTYQASAPGEPPANRSGRLAGSFGYKVSGHSQALVYSTAPYARFLEEGTGKMRARPFFAIVLESRGGDLQIDLGGFR